MQDVIGPASAAENEGDPPQSGAEGPDRVVSTHVLVPEEDATKLRDLSRKTRVAQSEYLREAVDDLLDKYGKTPPGEEQE